MCLERAVNDPSHPDYVPTIFVFVEKNETKNESKLKRFESAKKRKLSCSATTTNSSSCSTNINLDQENHLENEISIDFNMTEANHSHLAFSTPVKQKTKEDQYVQEIENLRVERDQYKELCDKISLRFISFESLKDNNRKFKYYTGIDKDKFMTVFEHLQQFLPSPCKSNLPYIDQFLMTLVKLRLNQQWENLADQFNSNKTSLNDIFWRWIDILYKHLSFLIKWPDHDAAIHTIPPSYKKYFPRLTGIIDCFEIFIDRPKNLKARAQVYSNYKKHSTVKFLIACTPQGSISFLSKGWGGRTSDVELVKNSKLLNPNLHHPGDQILADRGFTLIDEFGAKCGVELVIPSFTKGKKQLSAQEVETTRQLASIRIHIERVIGLLKNRYTILSSGPIPIFMIKSLCDEANGCDFSSIDKIVTVCAILINLGGSIVYCNEDVNEPLEK